MLLIDHWWKPGRVAVKRRPVLKVAVARPKPTDSGVAAVVANQASHNARAALAALDKARRAAKQIEHQRALDELAQMKQKPQAEVARVREVLGHCSYSKCGAAHQGNWLREHTK